MDKVPEGGRYEAGARAPADLPWRKTRERNGAMEGYCHIRETMWQKVENVDSMLRYFAHLDEKDDQSKQVYDARGVLLWRP